MKLSFLPGAGLLFGIVVLHEYGVEAKIYFQDALCLLMIRSSTTTITNSVCLFIYLTFNPEATLFEFYSFGPCNPLVAGSLTKYLYVASSNSISSDVTAASPGGIS